MSAPAPLLPFVQLEFPGSVGIGDGRYLARSDGEASEVLVVATLGRRARRRADAAGATAPRALRRAPRAAAVPVTRLTVVTPAPLGPDEAGPWLDEVSKDADAAEAQVETALRLVNRALSAQRAGVAEPLRPRARRVTRGRHQARLRRR